MESTKKEFKSALWTSKWVSNSRNTNLSYIHSRWRYRDWTCEKWNRQVWEQTEKLDLSGIPQNESPSSCFTANGCYSRQIYPSKHQKALVFGQNQAEYGCYQSRCIWWCCWYYRWSHVLRIRTRLVGRRRDFQPVHFQAWHLRHVPARRSKLMCYHAQNQTEKQRSQETS